MSNDHVLRELIFISHSSLDKSYVEEVLRHIPQSHLFYDIQTINPGEENIDALKRGLEAASVFVMFVSPHTPNSAWVNFEAAVAQYQKIKRQNLAIIVCPIQGATYKDAPEWMQVFTASSEKYNPSDIARLIKHAYEDSLRKQGLLKQDLFIGREGIVNDLLTEARVRPVQKGVAINFVILGGLQNMGRTSIAKQLIPRIYPGSRSDTPIIDLGRHSDSLDLFLVLRADQEGGLTEVRLQELREAWPLDDPKREAEIIFSNLRHYAELNQTIVIRSARGLRDIGRDIKLWLRELFVLLSTDPNVRIVWISERLLEEAALDAHKNVLQWSVNEIDENSIFIILSELLGAATSTVTALRDISRRLNGHPGTAHYVAKLIKQGQRSPEAITQNSRFVASYQQQFLEDLLDENSLTELQIAILHVLSIFPSVEFRALAETLGDDFSQDELASALSDLTDFCVVTYSLNLGYKVPEIVRSVFLQKYPAIPPKYVENISGILRDRLKDEKFSIPTVEGIVFASVLLEGSIPDAFKNVVTGAMLHELVYQHHQLGMRRSRTSNEWRKHFEIAAKLALLTDVIKMTRDSRETVLFYGAEAMIRIGEDPADLVQKMERYGFPSANFIRGSYLYHLKRDGKAAAVFLHKALRARSFTGRTARLLAKIHTELNEANKALEIFEELGNKWVHSDSGLLSQKIKCLRAVGNFSEATRLMGTLQGMNDEYGDYELMAAAQFFRDGRYNDALSAVDRARLKSRVNHVNLTLLEAAIKIESKDNGLLEEACSLAVATGRADDACNLRARAALHKGKWAEAEEELLKIQNANYFDNHLRLRILTAKLQDPTIRADPTLAKKIQAEKDALLVKTRSAIIDFDRN